MYEALIPSTVVTAKIEMRSEVGLLLDDLQNGNAWSRDTQFNTYALKRIFNDLDLGVEKPLEVFQNSSEAVKTEPGESEESSHLIRAFDFRLPESDVKSFHENRRPQLGQADTTNVSSATLGKPIDLVKPEQGDKCPQCEGRLRVCNAVELGHTFHLGTRYSEPLDVSIAIGPSSQNASATPQQLPTPNPIKEPEQSGRVAVQMGCHGVGVSRMMAAIADAYADSTGLSWPPIIAPFQVIVIAAPGLENDATRVYDVLSKFNGHSSNGIDIVLDDRPKPMVWKLKDADLIGYPVMVVLGKAWRTEGRCEIQWGRMLEQRRGEPSLSRNSTLTSLDTLGEVVKDTLQECSTYFNRKSSNQEMRKRVAQ